MRSRLPLAVVATVAAAGIATIALLPRSGQIDPAAVDAGAYFSRAQIDRARDFAGPARWIGIGQLVLSLAAMVALVRAMPRRLEARPLLGGALVGAGIALLLALVGLPLSIWSHERAVDFGISTQSLGPWFGDVAKSTGISMVLGAFGGLIALAVIRRFPRRWWIAGSAAVAVIAVAFAYLWPVVVDPVFNRFEPLPRGQLRSEVLDLAKKADVDVGQVYRVDASRRTTAINAYVVGIGHTKRVVLYDNLIEKYPRRQVRSVVAHELGHVHSRDVPRGLLFVFIVTPAGLWLAQLLAQALSRGALDGRRKPGPAALPAVALAIGVVSFALTCSGNVLSRSVEAHADAFSLRLTNDPAASIALDRSLALRNVNDPDPPALYQAIFGTHPTTVQRIGAGVRWREEGRESLSR